jgi:hypothetical protein
LLRTGSAQTLASEIDPVRIMNEAIKNRVGVRGSPMISCQLELRGADGRIGEIYLSIEPGCRRPSATKTVRTILRFPDPRLRANAERVDAQKRKNQSAATSSEYC